jgi:hypothetical protein
VIFDKFDDFDKLDLAKWWVIKLGWLTDDDIRIAQVCDGKHPSYWGLLEWL